MAIASGSFTGQRVPFVTSVVKEGGTMAENNSVRQSVRHRYTTLSTYRQVYCCKQVVATVSIHTYKHTFMHKDIMSVEVSNICVEIKYLRIIFYICILCVKEMRQISSSSEYICVFPWSLAVVCYPLVKICEIYEGNRVTQTEREM